MQRVYSAASAAEANLVQGYLELAGLQAIVQGGELGGIQGLLPTGESSAAVYVPDDEVERAEELVEEFLSSQPAEAEAAPWKCPSCGEELEPQFTECWNCGASRIAPAAEE